MVVLLRLLASALNLHLVLIQPNHPNLLTLQALFVFPQELPVILLALLALPRRTLVTVVSACCSWRAGQGV